MTESAGAHNSTVSVSVHDDGVAVVEFARGRANYFDAALIGGIADAYEKLAAGGTARAIVLCSSGPHFCAGLDFGGTENVDGTVASIYAETLRLFNDGLPVIAAVQGAAIGGGLGLAMTADFRIGGPDTRIAANFVRLGLHHGFGLSVTLPRAAGPQAAADLLLSARELDARQALALGVVDRLSDSAASLRADAVALAGTLAGGAPLAMASVRRTLRGPDLAEQVRVALAHELSEQAALMRTRDFTEGLAAARERRPARFSRQ